MASVFQISDNWRTWTIYALVLVLFSLVTFGSLYDHVLEGDDFEYLRDTAAVREDPGRLFSPDRRLPGRPAVEVILLGAHILWGNNPALYHVLLVCLHLSAAFLLAFTFKKLGVDLELSFLGALLFFLNVAHFRAVHWIACLGYPLALFLGLIALLAFAEFLKTGRPAWITLSTGLLATAVIAHASAVSFGLFCIYLAHRHGKSSAETIASTWPLILVTLVVSILLPWLFPQAPQAEHASFFDAPPHPIDSIRKLLWFLGRLWTGALWISADLHRSTLLEWGVGLLYLVGVFLLRLCRHFPVADWAVWSILGILPFIHNPLQTWMAGGPSRYLYLASAGSSLVLAWIVRSAAIWIAPRKKPIVFTGILAGCLLLSIASLKRAEAVTFYLEGRAYIARELYDVGLAQLKRAVQQNRAILPSDVYSRLTAIAFMRGESPLKTLLEARRQYPDDRSLQMMVEFCAFLQEEPGQWQGAKERITRILNTAQDEDQLKKRAAILYNNLGAYYYGIAHLDRAIDLYAQAIRLQPEHLNARVNLAKALGTQQQIEQAIQVIRTALQYDPTHPPALRVLGLALYEQGRFDEAAGAYQKLVQESSASVDDRYCLAEALFSSGRTTEAAQALQAAVALDSTHAASWHLLALVRRHSGDPDAAHRAIARALRLDPSHRAYWIEYASIGEQYHRLGQTDRAVEVYRRIIQATPDHTSAHFNLAILYYSEGRYDSAAVAFQRTIRLSPDDWEAHLGLAQACEKLDRFEIAAHEYRQTLMLNPGNPVAQTGLDALTGAGTSR